MSKQITAEELRSLSFAESYDKAREINLIIDKLTDICFDIGIELAEIKGEPSPYWGN